MPDIKEKLVELLNLARSTQRMLCDECGCLDGPGCYDCEMGTTADQLIANGVTIHEWIPVEERLPEPTVNVLACYADGEIDIDAWYRTFGHFLMENDDHRVTHWMPLPEPPKGEMK